MVEITMPKGWKHFPIKRANTVIGPQLSPEQQQIFDIYNSIDEGIKTVTGRFVTSLLDIAIGKSGQEVSEIERKIDQDYWNVFYNLETNYRTRSPILKAHDARQTAERIAFYCQEKSNSTIYMSIGTLLLAGRRALIVGGEKSKNYLDPLEPLWIRELGVKVMNRELTKEDRIEYVERPRLIRPRGF